MDIAALADHANEMLTVIAKDLETPQNRSEQSEKAKGNAPEPQGTRDTAAEEHGAGRAESGFTVEQMVAEFRALRASVLRLWIEAEGGAITSDQVHDLTRFNEAIDQALSESVSRYSHDLDRSKEMFLAMLGHDLRSPLGAIMMSAEFMLERQRMDEADRTLAGRVSNSAKRMQRMIGDLLDFTRSRLGPGIPVVRAEMDMHEAVRGVVAEIVAAHPGRTIDVVATGNVIGEWDHSRIAQAMTNLVGNAVEHGGTDAPVTISIKGGDEHVVTTIHNGGTPISAGQLNDIFGPMKSREVTASTEGSYGNLGLGLYIAERIVHAHNGEITVESSKEKGTSFVVRLPRNGAGAG